ncbi:precorrin methylase [Rhizobium sp. AC44/96]|uniref:cobalamin biosynthesis protein n=1 Tax=Rhizobium sp. AC44/96 TaxID=1841654 RepID=UPI00080F7877|nr:cobalamin biosynthesis protein [Rhizobium sp. AC44/96]OCJ04396.1 precorrin methylase [Rhizobium sp. AC44/96]
MSKIEFDNRRRYAVGIGCERAASVDEVHELVMAALAVVGVGAEELAVVASIDTRAEEPAILAVAERFSVPVLFFQAEALEAETPRIKNPSDIVFARVGCHGVAESAALAAIGPLGELLLPKTKSRRATVAIAQMPLQKQ